MKHTLTSISKINSFKIVLIYATVSAVYIYTSDYFLAFMIQDIHVMSNFQTYKGLGFIFITSLMLYALVKQNTVKLYNSFKQLESVSNTFNKKIKQSQEEYMALFNHSPMPMWIFEISTLKFLKVNEAAISSYGYTNDEFLNMTIKDIRPEEDIPLFLEMMAASLQFDRYDLPYLIKHRKKNGELIQVKVKTTSVEFEGHQARLTSATDITTEIESQNKLREINEKLQQAGEIAGLGYWTFDLIKDEIVWSEELYKIYEVDHNFELTLDEIGKFYVNEDRQHLYTESYAQQGNYDIQESEHCITTSKGNFKWIIERQFIIHDHHGNPIRREGIVLDITNRHLHEQEILESNERFSILARATVEVIIDWDIRNDKVIWGEGFHTLLGYDLSRHNNTLWSDNIHPDDRDQVLQNLQIALSDPSCEYFNASFRFLKSNGDIAFMQHRGIFIRDTSGKATRALAAMIDLTETLQRLKHIESQNKALKEIAWMQSHVVRAPLANLIGFVNALKEQENTSVTEKKFIEYISKSANQLDEIIHDIVQKTTEIDPLEHPPV